MQELSRVVVLCLSRSLTVSLASAEAVEPLLARLGVKLWPATTLALFPPALAAHCEPAAAATPDRQAALRQQLQDEYIMWRCLSLPLLSFLLPHMSPAVF